MNRCSEELLIKIYQQNQPYIIFTNIKYILVKAVIAQANPQLFSQVYFSVIFYQQNYRYMSRYAQIGNDSDSDMEEIPSEFETGRPTLVLQYETDKLQHYQNGSLHGQYNKQKLRKIIHPDSFLLKTQEYMASRLKRINDIKDEHESRIMANCTFKPRVNKSASKSPRNISQFLQSQQNHLNKINQKKQQIKQRIEEDNKKNMTFSPRINPKKKLNNKENVHTRLYNLKDKRKDPTESHYAQNYSYIPKITKKGGNIIRNLPVNQLLYQDAMRRAEKDYDIIEVDTVHEKSFVQEKYVAQKCLKDFTNALNATGLIRKTIFNEEELGLILRELGYARYTGEEQNSLALKEKQLLHDCFFYLQEYGVTQINVYVFLLALGGIYNVDLNNEQIQSALVIDSIEGKKLHSYFDLLYRNRLFSDGIKKSRTPEKEPSQKPRMTTESLVMAERYRGKMIDRTNTIFSENNIDIQLPASGLSHEDLLVIHNFGKNIEKEKLRQTKRIERDPQCTFQPNATKNPQQLSTKNRGENRCRELYEAARAKQDESKLPTFRSYINQEQKLPQKQNCSLLKRQAPSPIGKSSNVKSYLQIKDVDKVLSRMVMGRKQRAQKLQLQQRGQLSSQRVQNRRLRTCQPQMERIQSQLLLDADILVNNQKKKIYIYKQDENRISQVVDQFAKECELDSCSRDMLYQRLIDAVQSLKKETADY